MADIESRLLALYPVLASLDAPERQRILRDAHPLKIPAGTTIFDERQRCQGLPLLLEGSIRVVKCSPSGRELPLYRVTPGETCIITSSCLLGNTPYNARGVAEGEVSLLLLPESDFGRLLQFASFRDFVFRLFAERMADLMELVEEVAFRKLDQRLAALLLGKGHVLHVTHQQLADELGSVREIVSRLLKGFAIQGLVSLAREQIEILDPARLRRIAARDD
jgi:CRP/FNR family transcriptional regulator